jgi:hypothetical protein
MLEGDFRRALVQAFGRRSSRFIWAFDAKFKAGWPDLYWVSFGRSFHAELKLVKTSKMPENPWSLADKIQLHTMKELEKAGAGVKFIVLHAPPRGPKMVHYFASTTALPHVEPYTVFLDRWKWLW